MQLFQSEDGGSGLLRMSVNIDGVTYQKMAIFIITAVINSNLP
jgi:hypothetical protein